MLRLTGQALRARGPLLDEAIVRLSEAGLGDVAAQVANLLQSVNQGGDAAVPASAKRVDHLHANALVLITGLRSRPELNGRCGRIVGRDVHGVGATTVRLQVQIEGEPGPLRLKPENLAPPPRDAEDQPFDAQAFSP